MPLGEFDLIGRYFNRQQNQPGLAVGIGDDAAVVDIPADHQLVVTADTLVAGVHFPEQTSSEDIGYKSLAVNLSDLAAMGAVPRWYTLALTMPEANDAWLSGFSAGLAQLETDASVVLIGGDTTRGPLAIGIQAMGLVRRGAAVRRAGAKVGDDVYVTGALGDAALGLKYLQGDVPGAMFADAAIARCIERLNRPQPRNVAGRSLAPFVNAMIDCSDGFAADLGHILTASDCGAEIELARLPLSTAGRRWVDVRDWHLAFAGGDDYELIFTAAPAQRDVINGIADNLDCPITPVGRIMAGNGMILKQHDGSIFDFAPRGYTHF